MLCVWLACKMHSIAVSGLSCRKVLVGTGRIILSFLALTDLHITTQLITCVGAVLNPKI